MRSILAIAGLTLGLAARAVTYTPTPTQDDLNNPHKGFMLWGTTWGPGDEEGNYYGSSVYHIYVPWREVETADQVFDWTTFEANHFAPILAVDAQATFLLRLVADYPDGVGTGLAAHYTGGQNERDYPLFLEQPPLNIPGTDYASCDGDGPGRAPGWNTAAFQTQAVQLIQAFAARYDNDPRITAIQVGLLGLWGEWHQTGCESLEPGNAVKVAVRDAYAQAFTHARLQTRYPRNPDAVGVNFGFHEDYFPSFTANCIYGFPACEASGDWNMEYGFANVVPAARENWRVNPISGESPLQSQKNAWTNDTADILTVLGNYHFSFLGPAGKHEENGFAAQLAPIKRKLGYDLSVAALTLPDTLGQLSSLPWRLDLANRGSAPAYHGFEPRLDFVGAGGAVAATARLAADPRTALPGATTRYAGRFVLSGIVPGTYSLRLAVASTSAGRNGIVLQNAPRDTAGRVVLGDVAVGGTGDRIFADGCEAP
jgi:hypothetical protein